MVCLDAYTMRVPETRWAELERFGELTLHDRTTPEQVVERAAGAGVVLTNKVPLRREHFEALPDLRLVCVLATGYNIIDLEAARECGVTVCNVPAYSAPSVAQHTFALLLALTNHVTQHDYSVHAGDWAACPDFCYWKKPLLDFEGKTLGLIGFGDIGRRVGAIAHAFGLTVQATVRTPKDAPDWPGFRWVSMEENFATADFVSLHLPQTPENKEFVNAALLDRMKASAFFVNTARGTLAQEADLAAALNAERLAGAALDVLSTEPPQADNPLLSAKNCLITPHIAWSGPAARERLLRWTEKNIAGYESGEPVNVVS